MASSLKDRRALVLYGSETGNAQDVAEELGRIAERLRFDTEVAELNAVNLVCQPPASPAVCGMCGADVAAPEATPAVLRGPYFHIHHWSG